MEGNHFHSYTKGKVVMYMATQRVVPTISSTSLLWDTQTPGPTMGY
jgi:hypothetical protein